MAKGKKHGTALIRFVCMLLLMGGGWQPCVGQDTISRDASVQIITQVGAEPVVGGCEYVQHFEYEKVAIKNENDSLKIVTSSYISCPYQVFVTSIIKFPKELLVGPMDSISITFSFTLKTGKNYPNSIPPPLIGPMGVSSYRDVAWNQNGAGKDDKLMVIKSVKGSLNVNQTIDANYLMTMAVESSDEKTRFVDVRVKNSSDRIAVVATFEKAKTIDNNQDLYVIQKGNLLMIDEVIDPISEMVYEIKDIRINGKKDTLPIWPEPGLFAANSPIPDTVGNFFGHSDSSYIGENLLGYKKYMKFIYWQGENNFVEGDSNSWDMGKLAFRTLSQSDSLRKFDLRKVPMNHNQEILDPIHEGPQEVQLIIVGILEDIEFPGQSKIGYVSNSVQPGMVPLFQADHGDGQYRYSLCLMDLVNDPDCTNYSILCYVFPPSELRFPCPP